MSQLGTLEMSGEPLENAVRELAWSDFTVNRIFLIVAMVLVMLNLNEILQVSGAVLRSFGRRRGFSEFEHSVNLAKDRNIVAILLLPVFCTLAGRFSLYNPSFVENAGPNLRTALILGAILAYLLLRRILFALFHPRRMDNDNCAAIHFSLFSIFAIVCELMCLSLLALSLFHASDSLIRTVLLCEIGAGFGGYIIVGMEILASNVGGFASFLYLCILELLPAAILITSSVK